MNLGQFTEPKLLVPSLLAEFRDSTIFVLSQRLESAQRIDDSIAFSHAVLDHESRVSSVFDKVAFPMARGRTVRELSFALGLSQKGVRWGTGRTPLVHMVFLLAVPLSEGQRYISLVLTLSSLLKEQTVFSALRRCTQPEEMWTVLNHVRCVRAGPGATEVQP